MQAHRPPMSPFPHRSRKHPWANCPQDIKSLAVHPLHSPVARVQPLVHPAPAHSPGSSQSALAPQRRRERGYGLAEGEYALQALHPLDRASRCRVAQDVRGRPRHRRRGLVGIHPDPCSPWLDFGTVLEVRGKHPLKPGQIQPRPGHQERQPRHGRSCASLRQRHTVHPEHEIQRLQHHVRRPIPKRPLAAINHPAPRID
jgi:hypothetical protein